MLSIKDSFPSLSSTKYQKRRKNVHNNPAEDSSTVTSVASEKPKDSGVKTLPCKSVLQGNDCPYKNKCKYAHYKEEWTIKDCLNGRRCNRVRGDKCRNVDSENMCLYLHPHEDLDMFFNRLKIDVTKFIKPSGEDINMYKHFTKMCDSYFLGVPCLNTSNGKMCTYAHQLDELSVRECMFKDNCHFVKCENGGIYVSTKDSVCMYSHLHETFDNYVYRVIEPRRKIVTEKTAVPKKEYIVPNPIPENKEKSWADIMCNDEEVKEEVAPEDSDEISIECSSEDLVKILNIMITKGKKNFKIKITN